MSIANALLYVLQRELTKHQKLEVAQAFAKELGYELTVGDRIPAKFEGNHETTMVWEPEPGTRYIYLRTNTGIELTCNNFPVAGGQFLTIKDMAAAAEDHYYGKRKKLLVRQYSEGQRLTKKNGSQWIGKVVGTYSTKLTPEGYCIESEAHAGSVQIYPASALQPVDD